MPGAIGQIGRIGRIGVANPSMGVPVPPAGFVFLTEPDGAYLIDTDGRYLIEAA